MILIFAVDENWGIGYNGQMLTHIKADLTRFRLITENNIVVMGRKTFEALPNRQPLANRINIVISTDKEYNSNGAYNVSSLEELNDLLNEINKDNKKVFVIGGGNVVKQMIDQCNEAYITKIYESFENVDAHILNLDLLEDWKIVKESEIHNQDGLEYRYVDYVRD